MNSRIMISIALVCGCALVSCKKGEKKNQAPPAEPAPPAKTTEAPPATPQAPLTAEARTIADVGFDTPESVRYEPEGDVYLVANITGSPVATDGTGFISRVKPDGEVESLKWIDGAAEGTTLNAPKGMALLGDKLYVADITHIRIFDRKTGAPAGEIAIEGATFLNDLSAGSDTLYASDTGVKINDKGAFESSGSAAIYKVTPDGKATALLADAEMPAPNGVSAAEDGVWVVTFGANQLFKLDASGKKGEVIELPAKQLDGVEQVGDGRFLVSSWEKRAILLGKPGGEFKEVYTDLPAPADIGFDSARKAVLVPLFNDNQVRVIPLDK